MLSIIGAALFTVFLCWACCAFRSYARRKQELEQERAVVVREQTTAGHLYGALSRPFSSPAPSGRVVEIQRKILVRGQGVSSETRLAKKKCLGPLQTLALAPLASQARPF